MRNTLVKAVIYGSVAVTVAMMVKKLHTRACITGIGLDTARNLVDENRHNPDFVILDVRTLPEYMDGHIDVALPIDFHSRTFMDEVNKLDKTKTYLVYSDHGGRSRKAAHIMRKLGYRRVRVLAGGYQAWADFTPSST